MVLEGSSGRNLAFGPVHDAMSVRPGPLGNSVIEGHRDTHFKILRNAKPGDHVLIETVVTYYPFDAVNPAGPLRWAVTADALSANRSDQP